MAAPSLSREAAQSIVEAVQAVPGIAAMHSGRFGEVSLLFTQERIAGLRFNRDDNLEVHVTAETGEHNLHDVAEQVRETASKVLASESLSSTKVDVFVGDIVEAA